jgi:FkbM family methyltransferase
MVKNLKTRILRFLLLIKPVRYLLYNYKNFKKLRVFNNLDLKTDSLFIDFGANEGIVSQYIFDKYKCNIVAYEPHPACEEILKKKFKNNKKVKLFFGAVTDTSIDNKLYFHKKNKNLMDLNYSQAASLEVNKQNIDKNNYITIKSYNISEILNSFESIDCLKIDIEGYEYKILPEIIKQNKKIKKVFCELHGKPGTRKNDYLNTKYLKLINELKRLNLYNNWFIEHY